MAVFLLLRNILISHQVLTFYYMVNMLSHNYMTDRKASTHVSLSHFYSFKQWHDCWKFHLQ